MALRMATYGCINTFSAVPEKRARTVFLRTVLNNYIIEVATGEYNLH